MKSFVFREVEATEISFILPDDFTSCGIYLFQSNGPQNKFQVGGGVLPEVPGVYPSADVWPALVLADSKRTLSDQTKQHETSKGVRSCPAYWISRLQNFEEAAQEASCVG